MTHREMRNSSGEILRAVAAGESVRVTNNGQLAAVISPPPFGNLLAELERRGEARPPRRPLSDLGSLRRRKASQTSGELISDARGRW